MLKNLLSLLITTSLLTTAHADQLIIEPDMGRTPILNAIQSTQHSLNLVMYGLTDQTLLNALIKQKQRGRTVKVILEQSPYKFSDENTKAIQQLQDNKIDWLGKIPPFRLIHQKTLIIDNHEAMVMTFNFTGSTFKKTRNFGLVLTDPQEVKEIAQYFSADWNYQPFVGKSTHLIWSPDNSRERIIAAIKQARQSILMYAQSVGDYKVVGELANAARSGVEIDILTSKKLIPKLANYLKRAGVQVRYDNHYYIHAKAMIIDNKTSIIGSTNLTRQSLDDNRELSVITNDANVIKQLTSVFKADWNESTY